MEQIINGLKTFLLKNLTSYLDQLKDTDTPLPALTEKDIIVGPVDTSRYENKILCVFVPESAEETDGDISSVATENRMTVSFLLRGRAYDVLVRQMFRYAKAFKLAVKNDYTLNGICDDCTAGKTTFFTDAGTIEKQMTVAEIDFSVTASEEIDEED